MKNVDFIVTAKHYSKRERADGSVRGRILKMRESYHKQKGIVLQVLSIDAPTGEAVKARIWQGQWIGDCECGGAEFVEPSEPIFYCFSCANRSNDHHVRPVLFPDNVQEIEAAVLERPVDDVRGLDDLQRAGMARPVIVVEKENEEGGVDLLPLCRSWNPGESLEDLQKQNEVVKKWKDVPVVDAEKGKKKKKEVKRGL